jgi:hypothetical protein
VHAYDTHHDVLRTAHSRAHTYAREQEAALRKTLAHHHTESEQIALSAERKHRAFQPRRPTDQSRGSDDGARASTAAITDPKKRAEEMLRKADVAATHHQDATLRKFDAERARIEARKAKSNHRNVSQRIGIELERRRLGEWDAARLVPHKTVEVQHEMMEAHYRRLREFPTGRRMSHQAGGSQGLVSDAQKVFVEEKSRLAARFALRLAASAPRLDMRDDGRGTSAPMHSFDPSPPPTPPPEVDVAACDAGREALVSYVLTSAEWKVKPAGARSRNHGYGGWGGPGFGGRSAAGSGVRSEMAGSGASSAGAGIEVGIDGGAATGIVGGESAESGEVAAMGKESASTITGVGDADAGDATSATAGGPADEAAAAAAAADGVGVEGAERGGGGGKS